MILWRKGLWKFNNSLTSKAKSCFGTLCILDQANITDKQFRWEFLNYKIRKFSIQCLKNIIKEESKDEKFVEK